MRTVGHYSASHRWKQVRASAGIPCPLVLDTGEQTAVSAGFPAAAEDAVQRCSTLATGTSIWALGDALIMSSALAHSPVIWHLDTQGWYGVGFFGTGSQMTPPSPSLNAPSFSSWHQIQSPACGCHLLLFVVPRQEPEALNITGRDVRFSSRKVTP